MKRHLRQLTLSIDTSCDETAAAVVHGTEVVSNIVASQVELHKPFGGVFPTVAKQAHKEQIWQVIALALRRARVKPQQITEIAVTVGPGLAPALEVGISAAVDLAVAWAVPLRPVNHLEGHLLSVLAKPVQKQKSYRSSARHINVPAHLFPVLGILMSGGHSQFFRIDKALPTKEHKKQYTELSPTLNTSVDGLELTQFLITDLQNELNIDPMELDFSTLQVVPVSTNQTLVDRYPNLSLTPNGEKPFLHSGMFSLTLLGSTLDDAAGEALDKIGRMVNLGYPAGPVMEEFAKKGTETAVTFPLPLTHVKDYNLSFSGLKTFARNHLIKIGGAEKLGKQAIYDFSASAQRAIFAHICYKLHSILTQSPEQKSEVSFGSVWVCGGVAANAKFRQMVRATVLDASKRAHQKPPTVLQPYTKKLYGDNAAMIGVTI